MTDNAAKSFAPVKYDVPVVVRTFDTYAGFNASCIINIPSEKKDHGEVQTCPDCGEVTNIARMMLTDSGQRFSGICETCGARWHRWMDAQEGHMDLYTKEGGVTTFTIQPFTPEKEVEDAGAEATWTVDLHIEYINVTGVEDPQAYDKSWTCPASALPKTRRLARLRIRKQSKALRHPFSIKDAEVVKDEESYSLTIVLEVDLAGNSPIDKIAGILGI